MTEISRFRWSGRTSLTLVAGITAGTAVYVTLLRRRKGPQPPGPVGTIFLGSFLELLYSDQSQLFFHNIVTTHGPIAQVWTLGVRLIVLADPTHIPAILASNVGDVHLATYGRSAMVREGIR